MMLFLYPFGGEFMDALTDKQMVRVNWKPIHASFTPSFHVVKGSGRGDLFRVENQGNFAETVALQPQVKDVPHYRSSHRVNLQNVSSAAFSTLSISGALCFPV